MPSNNYNIGGITEAAKSKLGVKVNQQRSRYTRVAGAQSRLSEYTRDPNVIQIPGEHFPHSNFVEALWVRMTAKELQSINTAGRGGTLRIGKKGATFKFLAPSQIIETHNHQWENYETIQSKILQKVVGFKTGVTQLESIGGNLTTGFAQQKGLPSGRQLTELLSQAGTHDIPKYKIDTPLVYKSSQRRQYQLTFVLADSTGGTVINKAVKLLQQYAAAEEVSNISINFPYIFSITTEPEGLLNIKYAALESVLATWMEPYIKGQPVRCELTLSIKDMEPLFRNTISESGLVNVNMPGTVPTTEINLTEQHKFRVPKGGAVVNQVLPKELEREIRRY